MVETRNQKRSRAASPFERPPKRSRTDVETGAKASNSIVVDRDNADVAVARDAVEQGQEQESQSEELLLEPLKEEGHTNNDAEIEEIDQRIAKVVEKLERNERSREEEQNGLDTATKFFLALHRSQSLDPLFKDPNNALIFLVIREDQSRKGQEVDLKKYLNERAKRLPGLEQINLALRDDLHKLEKKKEQLQDRKRSGMVLSHSKGNRTRRSGIHYIEETFRVQYLFHDELCDIGIIEKVDDLMPKFQINPNIESWGPCPELVEAWKFIPESESDGFYLTFPEFFVSHFAKLDRAAMKNAWVSLTQKTFELSRDNGAEMTLQQCICTPFIELFMAAAGPFTMEADEYIANQQISSSLTISCKMKEGDEKFEEKKFSIMPDVAVTLKQKWDAFGMIEMKRGNHEDEKLCLRDIDKCTLMTAITAILVGQSINDKSRHHEIAIPFLIAKGYMCGLYVTTLDELGIPRIKKVQYPEDRNNTNTESDEHDIAVSPSRSRTELFVALAILLNKLKLLMDGEAHAKYKAGLRKRRDKVKVLPSYSLNGVREGHAKQKDGSSKKSRSRTYTKPGTSGEKDAKQAATCGGMFLNLESPFLQEVLFAEDGLVHTRVMKSPFYFLADWTSSNNGSTPKCVFLKVWKDGDVDMDDIQSEYDNYRQAYKAGIPVAAPVLDKLVRSPSASGSEYLIFAVEYIHNENVRDEKNFLQFCTSLIEAVIKLHEKAGLLHCDIKPSNMRWSNQILRLIDFGHSQQIHNATWSPGTEGYEAPEIVHGKMPCSTKTDAFSVGATIMKVWKELNKSIQKNHLCQSVHEVAVRLQDSDPDKRWSLPQALRKIRSLPGQNVGSPPNDQSKEFQHVPTLVSPSSPVEVE